MTRNLSKGHLIFFFLYLLGTIGASLAVKTIQSDNETVNSLVPRLILLTVAFVIPAVVANKHPVLQRFREWIVIGLCGFYLTVFSVFLLRNTYYGLYGLNGDAEFITASITKYAHFWNWGDFSFARLSAFYPPLYFYVMGKLAWLLQMEPYKIVKYGATLVMMVGPLFVYFLWQKILSRKAALLFAILFFFLNYESFFYKPYEYLTLAIVLPWWFRWVDPDRNLGKSGKERFKLYAIAGLLGSLIFQTYYYWFFALTVYTIFIFVYDWFQQKSFSPVLRKYQSVFIIAGLILLFSSFYLVPLVIDLAAYGAIPLQSQWFKPYMLSIPSFDLINLSTFIYFCGFLSLFTFFKQSALMKKLSILLGACYFWHWLGMIGVKLKKPILHVKIHEMIYLILLVGFVYLVEQLLERWREKPEQPFLYLAILLVVFITFGQQLTQIQKSAAVAYAKQEAKPAEIKKIEALHPEGKVFLTENRRLYAYLPVYNFVTMNMHYTHHAGQRQERIQFLQEISKEKDPKFVAWMLRYNRFDPIDYVYLQNFRLEIMTMKQFPKKEKVVIQFAPELFDSPYFTKIAGVKDLVKVNPIPEEVYHQFTPAQKKLAQKYARLSNKSRNQ